MKGEEQDRLVGRIVADAIRANILEAERADRAGE